MDKIIVINNEKKLEKNIPTSERISFENKSISVDNYNKLDSKVKLIIRFVNNYNKGKIINEAIENLKSNKTINEVLRRFLVSARKVTTKEKVDELLELLDSNSSEQSVLTDILLEKLMDNYYRKKLRKANFEKLMKLLMNENYKKILDNIDEQFYENERLNLYLKKTLVKNIESLYRNSNEQLCFTCSNGYPNKCVKIFDHPKRMIDRYTFIKKGFQIYDDCGKLKHFIIWGCNNFEEEDCKIKTLMK